MCLSQSEMWNIWTISDSDVKKKFNNIQVCHLKWTLPPTARTRTRRSQLPVDRPALRTYLTSKHTQAAAATRCLRTCRRSVQSEPQLEPVRVVDLNFFQLWSQQDVFLSLWGDRKYKFHLCWKTHTCTPPRPMGLTWLANSRWHTVRSWGSFMMAVMICNMGVMPERKQVHIQTDGVRTKVCGHRFSSLRSKRKIS